MHLLRQASAVLLAMLPQIAIANETISYTYDVLGRVVTTGRSGTVNNNVNATYTYDKADNRTNVTVTGSAGVGAGFASSTEPDSGSVDAALNDASGEDPAE